MLFLVHGAVAYLCYRLLYLGSERSFCTDGVIVWLIAGALFPDVIDKPLSFLLATLPSRGVMHSLLLTCIIIVSGWYLTAGTSRSTSWTAFTIGYLSHLAADLVDFLFIPEETFLFLFWPIISDYHSIETPEGLLALVTLTPYVLGQIVLSLIAVVLWLHDGKPGLATISKGSPRR